MKIFLLLFVFLSSFVFSEEKDTANVIKENNKLIGIELGAGYPEFIFIGSSIWLNHNLDFTFKLGGSPLEKKDEIKIDETYTFGLTFYFSFIKKENKLERGKFNFSLEYSRMNESNISECIGCGTNYSSPVNYYIFRIGRDFYLNKDLAIKIQVGLMNGTIIKTNESALLPSGKLSLFYWIW